MRPQHRRTAGGKGARDVALQNNEIVYQRRKKNTDVTDTRQARTHA